MLRRERERHALLAEVPACDRLVLLGDVVELRHGPLRPSLLAAAPVLRELGAALGPDRDVVIVPGNHDHRLLRGWLERRAADTDCVPLGLETAVESHPQEALGKVVSWLQPARVSVAYPGVWLREDVYATHGHYSDHHTTVPLLERLGAGTTARVLGRAGTPPARAEDYEAILGPMYACLDAIAQSGGPKLGRSGSSIQVRMWRALTASSGARTGLRRSALGAAFPALVAVLRRAGLGALRPDLSSVELRRAALRAFGEVVSRLGVTAAHVIFGHTHRAGPLAGDEQAEWLAPGGPQLLNTGSWVYDRAFLGDSPAASPYRPGFCALVGADGPPRLVNVLDSVTPLDRV